MDRLLKRSLCHFGVTFAILAGLSEVPLAANPIHLRCVINDSYLASDYGGELGKVQKDLCGNLKTRLDSKPLLLAWEYIHFDGTGAVPRPALILMLSNEGQTRRLEVRLELQNFPPVTWTGIWKEPGDTLPDPLATKAPEFFANKTEELILARLEETIHKNLRPIAIATATWSPAGAPKVVTSLAWKGKEALRASRFRLVCQPENRELESYALLPADGLLSLEAKYRLPDRKSVSEILPEVQRLKPQWLFLLDFQIPDDTEVYTK